MRRKGEKGLERTARPLIELSLTATAVEEGIAEIGSLIKLPRLTGLTVGAVHGAHPP